MGERGLGIRSGVNKQSWEETDFPILCETCLGENPYIRMLKTPAGKECKICERPFTIFRWKAGPQGRFKKTEVCQTCAKLKNVCQTCLFDLQYGLPVQVRDKFLEDKKVDIPQQGANRDYWANEANRNLDQLSLPYDKPEANKLLEEYARNKPYYKRNLPHICSFWLKGTCNRGQECPYRHEKPEEGPLSKQNLKDRYIGNNDPVAEKILNQMINDKKIKPPEDKTITSILVKDLTPEITEVNLREHLKKYGTIDQIKIIPTKNMALVSFSSRAECEEAMTDLYGKFVLNDVRLNVVWAKYDKKSNKIEEEIPIDESQLIPQPLPLANIKGKPALPNIKPPSLPPQDAKLDTKTANKFIMNLTKVGGKEAYPSMNPNSLGGIKKQ